MPRRPKRRQRDDDSILGSSLVGTSNVLSYAVVTGAASLAFFFAFQAAIIGYFSSLYIGLSGITASFCGLQIPVGKIILTVVCLIMVLFTIWSYQMVLMTIHYIKVIMKSGSKIEERIEILDQGVFTNLLEANLL